MSPLSFQSTAAVLLCFFLGGPASRAQEFSGLPEDVERDWLEYYYQDPTPENFVSQMKEYSEEGILDPERVSPALLAFISQLMRQNRDKIDEWYQKLQGLPPQELQIFHTAMLYSRTGEADAILKRMYGEKFEEQKKEIPKILELQLDKVDTLDMLWGFYYATGSENAIRRIISCFQFADFPEDPDFAKVPSNYKPLYTDLPEGAAWSLVSNAFRHPEVKKYCEKIYQEEDALSETERRILKEKVLAILDPRKYGTPG